YAGETSLPAGFNICGHFGYNENAVLWHYRKANKLAQIRWGNTKDYLLKNVARYEEKAFNELPDLEKNAVQLINDGKKEEAQKVLNRYTADFAGATRQTWQEMEHKFWEMFWTGF
ncbi:MAG: peptidase, partial [Bacteroidales bacterium]|nr:peptidase [Bacteroidales bacterium]